MHDKNPLLPHFSIKPTSISLYYQRAYGASYNRGGDLIPAVPKNNKPKRSLSSKAQKRIKLASNWLYELAEWKRIYHSQRKVYFSFKVNFITLTLPSLQMHLDSTIKKTAFNSFLTYLRSYYSLTNYVWRCECQSNGNIHFHLLTDTFINYKTVRNAWNRQLKKLGYIDRYQCSFQGLSFSDYCLKVDPNGDKCVSSLLSSWKYGIKTNWRDPNTTDIHSLFNLKNPAAYIAKYLSKGEKAKGSDGRYELKSRRIEGRNWFVSQKLGRLKGFVDIRNEMIDEVIDYCEKLKGVRVVVEDYYKVIFVRFKDWKKRFGNLYKRLIDEMILKVNYVKGSYARNKVKIV